MNDLPRVNAPGLRVWRAVLLELLRRERDGEGAPSILALAKVAQKSDTQTKDHLAVMADIGLVVLELRMGQYGSDVALTPLGRLVARLVEVGTH